MLVALVHGLEEHVEEAWVECAEEAGAGGEGVGRDCAGARDNVGDDHDADDEDAVPNPRPQVLPRGADDGDDRHG